MKLRKWLLSKKEKRNKIFLSGQTDSFLTWKCVTHLKQIFSGFSVVRAPLTHICSSLSVAPLWLQLKLTSFSLLRSHGFTEVLDHFRRRKRGCAQECVQCFCVLGCMLQWLSLCSMPATFFSDSLVFSLLLIRMCSH